ncbi:unnamed protein product [Rhizophagus irregularis]|uniref:Uncharacterized protein n=1 Tax=Rhizophagus irregularis TaxID=588596 RepID=A0A915ZAP9_9GLOM|nr:unnamed protein product [Rhizophagus irregularis]
MTPRISVSSYNLWPLLHSKIAVEWNVIKMNRSERKYCRYMRKNLFRKSSIIREYILLFFFGLRPEKFFYPHWTLSSTMYISIK